MIKSDKGSLTVQGDVKDVIFEFHHFIREMAKNNPDVTSAVIFKNNKELKQAIEHSDKIKLQLIKDYIDHIEQVREDIENED